MRSITENDSIHVYRHTVNSDEVILWWLLSPRDLSRIQLLITPHSD